MKVLLIYGSKYFERTLDWEWKQFEDESRSNVSFDRFESDGNVSSESKEYSDTLTIASYLFRKPYFDRLGVLMHFKRVSPWVHLCTESRITTSSRPVKRMSTLPRWVCGKFVSHYPNVFLGLFLSWIPNDYVIILFWVSDFLSDNVGFKKILLSAPKHVFLTLINKKERSHGITLIFECWLNLISILYWSHRLWRNRASQRQ